MIRTAQLDALAAAESPDARRRFIAAAYHACCELELAALKPGNVHLHAEGHGMTVSDFRRSADASAGPLTEPGLRLGERILRAVEATRAVVGCNTNLGILLLCGPLVHAALDQCCTGSLRERLERALADADRDDSDAIFAAIRLAAPAGLGEAPEHDVSSRAMASPVEVMASAASWDLIARQYAKGFADLFDLGLPLLRRLERRWQDPVWAAAGIYLDFLSRFNDSHIARKLGAEEASRVRRLVQPIAARLIAADHPTGSVHALSQLDRELKGQGINPGTSADLTVATLLIRRLAPLCSDVQTQADECRLPNSSTGQRATGVSP